VSEELLERVLERAGISAPVVEMTAWPRPGPFAKHPASGLPSRPNRVEKVVVGGKSYVFKTGDPAKLRLEMRATALWQRVLPGASRSVIAYSAADQRAGILAEYVEGASLTRLFTDNGFGTKAVARLTSTLEHVWNETRRKERPAPFYGPETEERLEILLAARPRFRPLLDERAGHLVSGNDLLRMLRERETSLLPETTVLTHEDLTPDNVVDGPTGIRFLDVARSGRGDLLRDVGKFLAAMRRARFKRPDFGPGRPESSLLAAARRFAEETNDTTFSVRLKVARARTLLGSARLMDDDQAAWQLRQGFALLADALSG